MELLTIASIENIRGAGLNGCRINGYNSSNDIVIARAQVN